jgi:two-component system CheB/CheR fusion protein
MAEKLTKRKKQRVKRRPKPTSQQTRLSSDGEALDPTGKRKRNVTASAGDEIASTAAALEIQEPAPAKTFPVVGIGASAGGLEAFTSFLRALPADTGMAFVLVQHMDPTHESILNRLLAKNTLMPVAQVVNGTMVEPNHVYVIAPNTEMTISGGVLKLVGRPIGASGYRLIDTFFCSLAEDQKNRAIGVVLSGIGSDGTRGLQAIKAEGGITFAQDEDSAKYPGMPQHALTAGCVDLILSPDNIARELARMILHPCLKIAPQPEVPSEENDLRKLFRLLRSSSGVDFTNYKQTTIRRRIARRMLVRRCETLPQYAKYAGEHPEEVKALFDDVLIHVTSFFRDPDVYQFLKSGIFPRIAASLAPGDSIRIWVPGCSSGEEVYSIAIVLNEFLGDSAGQTRIQIFGTDISDSDIQKARAAKYSESATAEISPEQLRRFFVKIDGGYQVAKSIRDLCVFSRHDVTKDPPFSRLDLISCRNVLIYFAPVLQKKVLNYFHYALKPTGFLVLGKSESASAAGDQFTLQDRKANVYSKIFSSKAAFPEFRAFEAEKIVSAVPITKAPARGFDLRKEAERIILDQYAPPAVVVNADFRIIHFQGDTSPFLKPASGEASLDLMKIVRLELTVAIRVAIQEAKRSRARARRENIRFKHNSKVSLVDLEVVPITGHTETGMNFIVLFQDLRPAVTGKKRITTAVRSKSTREVEEVDQVKRDLAICEENLHALVQDQQATTEQLRAANEEILSSNEELQSTNEELETAKEELQSSNEELTTLNEEQHTRNVELTQTASDLNSLLTAVDIPIVILASDRRIRRFTPAAAKLMNLLPSDVGRPFAQVRSNLKVADLDRIISQVAASGRPDQIEVQDQNGHWYALRMRPYSTADGRLDGILVAAIDIDDVKQLSNFSRAIVETIDQPILVMDAQFRIISANAAFYGKFRVTRKETENHLLFELGNGQWNIPQLRDLLEKVLPEKEAIEHFEMEHDFPDIGHRIMSVNARQLHEEKIGAQKVLLVINDLTRAPDVAATPHD